MELTRYLSPRKVQGLNIPKCFSMATFSLDNKWGQADWCLFLPNSSIHQQQLHVGRNGFGVCLQTEANLFFSKRGCDCSDSHVEEQSICKPQLLVPGGWGAVKDDGGCLFYFNFSHNPHRVQYEPPELEEDGGGLAWREILSLSEATGLATAMAGGRPLCPMPPLIPPW